MSSSSIKNHKCAENNYDDDEILPVNNVLQCFAKECKYLKDFKDYLHAVSQEATLKECEITNSGSSGNITELRTRNATDNYTVSVNGELEAEVLMAVWNQLLMKNCHEHFGIGLLRLAKQDIQNELKNIKVRENLQPSKVSSSNDDGAANVSECCQLDLIKLQKYIQQYVNRLLIRLSDNSKADNLIDYAFCKVQCDSSCSASSTSTDDAANQMMTSQQQQQRPHITHAEAHLKNKHRKMEDRHIALQNFSDIYQLDKKYAFYGVFDGHSGSIAASYVTDQLPYLIAQQLKSTKYNEEFSADLHRECFESAFLRADQEFAKKFLASGTTAVCALLALNDAEMPQHLYVAWVGDSRCLLVSPTVHLQLVKSHRPDSIDERKRIEESGGAVMFVQGHWRVNGIINVSRSIGDYSVNSVIAEPDFVDVQLQSNHDFLVLGSDGLWDYVNETKLVHFIYESLMNKEQTLEDISKHLMEMAKEGDSQDNITAILVLLKPRKNIIENYKNSLKMVEITEAMSSSSSS